MHCSESSVGSIFHVVALCSRIVYYPLCILVKIWSTPVKQKMSKNTCFPGKVHDNEIWKNLQILLSEILLSLRRLLHSQKERIIMVSFSLRQGCGSAVSRPHCLLCRPTAKSASEKGMWMIRCWSFAFSIGSLLQRQTYLLLGSATSA